MDRKTIIFIVIIIFLCVVIKIEESRISQLKSSLSTRNMEVDGWKQCYENSQTTNKLIKMRYER